jgi:hypothetical protein
MTMKSKNLQNLLSFLKIIKTKEFIKSKQTKRFLKAMKSKKLLEVQ